VASLAAGALAYGRLCEIEREHATDPEPEPDLAAVVAESIAEGA
jgi:hypothetical protein